MICENTVFPWFMNAHDAKTLLNAQNWNITEDVKLYLSFYLAGN